jgi:RNA polymerase sigma-70 factor (ECF subfamily)
MKCLTALDDQQLIQLYMNGNSAAFGTLTLRYKDKIFTTIKLLVKDTYLAEDLLQDVFMRVIQTLTKGRYNEEGKFLPWVTRIAHNLCMDHFRKEKNIPVIRTSDDYDIFETLNTYATDVEERIVTNERNTDIKRMLDQLPADQREVIILRHFADLSFKEIATLTNCSINTSLGRMRYGLMNLRKMKQLETI